MVILLITARLGPPIVAAAARSYFANPKVIIELSIGSIIDLALPM
jgi:hypothetical protein